MNYRGLGFRLDLMECPICGMDAGRRMVTEEVPEQFYVGCEICGFKTKPCKTQSAATNEWSKLSRVKKK